MNEAQEHPTPDTDTTASPAGEAVKAAKSEAGTAGKAPSANAMKPITAAKKLGIFLPAAPAEFRQQSVTHDELVKLQEEPPQWLQDLRKTGPFPRAEVARKLGVTAAALKRNDMDRALTQEEIADLLENKPDWLIEERRQLAIERNKMRDANAEAAEADTAE